MLFPRVDAELKPWTETGITRQMLDNLWRCDNGNEIHDATFFCLFRLAAKFTRLSHSTTSQSLRAICYLRQHIE